MEKLIKSFVFLFLITILSNANVFAKNSFSAFGSESIGIGYDTNYLFSSLTNGLNTKAVLKNTNIAASPPTVTSPIYYCQNSVATPLTATPSGGGTLNWYNAVTAAALPGAPTPSTTTVGSTTYYVTQTITGVESTPRTPIVVNVVADNGATILGLTCDPSQILPADKNSSVFFDWGNNPAISNSYNYSYSVQGGPPVTGTTGTSHWQIFGMLPGQSATLILTSATHPCVPAQTKTCTVPCLTTVTPTFAPILTSYCINEVPPILVLPTTSTNFPAITGSWNPSSINTTTSGITNYIFTPDPVLFPCALTKTLPITVKALVTPTFAGIPTTVCQNATAPILPLSSTNTPAITGTWSPFPVDTATLGPTTYTFTPNSGQCASTTLTTVTITVVNPANTLVSVDWTVTNAFTDNQIVTVIASAAGNYLYQLDDGPFQVSPVFENVSSGIHTITVKDIYGCSTPITVNNVLVINYPKYFTPNGDSYNDTWNISGLKDQLNSRIYIFDRYGKLLKDISPQGLGWDGMYNGQPMPATDYWFTVEYTEQTIYKKFKSHFSLKR